MKSKIQISIPTPCHENWQNMTVVDKGRFCVSCQKNVIDFTKSSDREIKKAFDNNSNLCGRFNDSQLNRDLFLPKEKSTLWIAAASGVFAFLGIGTNTVTAQTHKAEQTDIKTTTEFKHVHDPMMIKGQVLDETGLPLPAASITSKVKGTKTQTDFDGIFKIESFKGDTLIFSYVGFEMQNLLIEAPSEVKIILKETVFDGVVIINGGAFVKKRTFFGRIFHSIGNFFTRKERV